MWGAKQERRVLCLASIQALATRKGVNRRVGVEKRSEEGRNLGPDAERGVPGTGAEGSAVGGDAEAGDAVHVASERLNAFAVKSVPDVAVVVVIASEEVASGDGESDGGDTAVEIGIGVGHELATGADVEESASGIIGTGSESGTRGEELNGVDIGSVTAEGLSACSGSNVP